MTTDVHCRLMVTRGVKAKPFQHPSLSRSGPTIVIIMEHSRPANALQSRGIRLATVPQVRGLPMSQDAKYNSHSKLNCVIACLQAEQAGADEGLMLDPHGFVNTTNACNFFVVRKGEVWTSTGDYCMNGVTRQKVIDLCRANDIPVFERNFSLVEAYGADEAFLTGTFGAQTPVAEIDGRPIGADGGRGPVLARIQALYRDLIASGHGSGTLIVEVKLRRSVIASTPSNQSILIDFVAKRHGATRFKPTLSLTCGAGAPVPSRTMADDPPHRVDPNGHPQLTPGSAADPPFHLSQSTPAGGGTRPPNALSSGHRTTRHARFRPLPPEAPPCVASRTHSWRFRHRIGRN